MLKGDITLAGSLWKHKGIRIFTETNSILLQTLGKLGGFVRNCIFNHLSYAYIRTCLTKIIIYRSMKTVCKTNKYPESDYNRFKNNIKYIRKLFFQN